MAVRVGINGFGRIGRLVVRAGWGAGVEFVAVNDLTDAATLAHLLKYDSAHRTWEKDVAVRDGSLAVDGTTVRVLAEANPAKLPWKDLGVDVVVESTGRFTDATQARAHLEAGARKVLISAPAKNADVTIAPGVNDDMYDAKAHHVVSAASCTTNCLAPIAKVVHDTFGILRGTMTTVHAYTNDQRILDYPHKDLRRARAAALSIIPTSTGAAKAIGLVVPPLAGKLDGLSLRVPVPDGSVVDMVAEVERDTTRAAVNDALRQAAETKPLKGYLRYTELPLVSADIVGDPHSAIVDGLSTMVVGQRIVKVLAWYDNEWGYSNRVVDLIGML
jgi:glyceraldehyde 3-phosphate dehydrogenase